MNKTKNKLLLSITLIFSILLLAGCSKDNRMNELVSLFKDNGPIGSASLKLNPEQSLIVNQNNALKNEGLRTIAPTDQDLVINSYDIVFKHNQYPYKPVELKDISGSVYKTDPVILQPGVWSVTIYAKNSKTQAIGLGIASIVINPGQITETSVSIRNIDGNTIVNLGIDLSDRTLNNPKVTGKFIEKKADGTLLNTIDLVFTVNDIKTFASYQGDIKSGFYEMELELQDETTDGYIPIANYHDTIGLYAGIPVEEEFYLSNISSGGGSVLINDEIGRPLKIVVNGVKDELVYSKTMDVNAYATNAYDIDRYEWRLNNTLIEGESDNSITLEGYKLLPQVHELEVIMWKGSVISSKKMQFTVNPVPLTVTLSNIPNQLLQGEEVTITATTPFEVDSYEWYLNGILIPGETKSTITLNNNTGLNIGNYTLEVRVRKGTVVRSAAKTFNVIQFVVDIQNPISFIRQPGSVTITAAANIEVDSYEWYINDTLIDGANQSMITLESSNFQTGTYTLTVKAKRNTAVTADNMEFIILPTISQISCGGYHSLMQRVDGTVWAWGYNNNGQLGDGTTANRLTPVKVKNFTNVISIDAGGYHTLALKSDGTVWAWGYNYRGQLGDGTTTNRSIPVQVTNLTNVVSIAAGDYHSLAIKSDGTVWAWGYNYYGQLGDGTTTNRSIPVQIMSNVISIVGGGSHSLAIKSDGTVWAWGYNNYGQLGDGTKTNRSTPVQTTNISGAVAISAGYNYSLAVKPDKTVWGWGDNQYYQIDSGTSPKLAPVQVNTDAIGIAAGYKYSLVLKSNGDVYLWGSVPREDGYIHSYWTPQLLQNISNVSSISSGTSHSLSLTSDGTILSGWENNYYGQIGIGNTNYQYTPVSVSAEGL